MEKATPAPLPATMLEAVRQFSDPKVAHDFFVAIRWPNGVACPRACGSVNVAYMEKSRRWYCNDCKGQFTAKVGTIFEDSPIGFEKWLPAIWLLASNRNGISSYELARALHVTQRTAWFMLHRIREAMQNEAFPSKMFGPVEADETIVGGYTRGIPKPEGGSKSRGPRAGKTVVMGIVERRPKGKGKVRAWVVPSTQRRTLIDKIMDNVYGEQVVYTDQHMGYSGLKERYFHFVINHAKEYVRGHVHTNSIEAFWSVFKRMVRGTYIAPRPKHLQRYVEEEVFRFNHREEKDGTRFPKLLARVEGARLTYKALTSES